MRLTTRITSGYALVVVLLVLVLVYQLVIIRGLETSHREQAQISFRAALVAVNALFDAEQVEEYAQKYLLLADPAYGARLSRIRDQYSRDLEELGSLLRSDAERRELEGLAALWAPLSDELREYEQRLPAARQREFPPPLQERLDGVKTQTQAVYDAIRRGIEAQVKASGARGQQAARVFWLAAVGAIVFSCLVSFVVVRSISRRLKDLTAGARAVAQGTFSLQLDASGGDEFAELAADFNTMSRRLGELDRLKKDFVAHVSHELKSPLASIRDTMTLLLEQALGPLTAEQGKLIRLLVERTKRLSAMIANLLDISRMEAGFMHYTMERRDLIPVVRTAVAELSAQDRGKKLAFDVDLPAQAVVVTCDADHLIRVLENLLDNATKFSPHGGRVMVRVQTVQGLPAHLPAGARSKLSAGVRPAYVLMSVADQGPGVDDVNKEKVFEKFHQVQQSGKATPQGVGLGLTICRTIVQAHQGTIWVEDNEGGGSRVCVLVPTDGEEAGALVAGSAPF